MGDGILCHGNWCHRNLHGKNALGGNEHSTGVRFSSAWLGDIWRMLYSCSGPQVQKGHTANSARCRSRKSQHISSWRCGWDVHHYSACMRNRCDNWAPVRRLSSARLSKLWGTMAKLAVQRKMIRSASFQPAPAAITMQARCLRYEFTTTLRCTVRTLPATAKRPGRAQSARDPGEPREIETARNGRNEGTTLYGASVPGGSAGSASAGASSGIGSSKIARVNV